jgi:hypothetical protein
VQMKALVPTIISHKPLATSFPPEMPQHNLLTTLVYSLTPNLPLDLILKQFKSAVPSLSWPVDHLHQLGRILAMMFADLINDHRLVSTPIHATIWRRHRLRNLSLTFIGHASSQLTCGPAGHALHGTAKLLTPELKSGRQPHNTGI